MAISKYSMPLAAPVINMTPETGALPYEAFEQAMARRQGAYDKNVAEVAKLKALYNSIGVKDVDKPGLAKEIKKYEDAISKGIDENLGDYGELNNTVRTVSEDLIQNSTKGKIGTYVKNLASLQDKQKHLEENMDKMSQSEIDKERLEIQGLSLIPSFIDDESDEENSMYYHKGFGDIDFEKKLQSLAGTVEMDEETGSAWYGMYDPTGSGDGYLTKFKKESAYRSAEKIDQTLRTYVKTDQKALSEVTNRARLNGVNSGLFVPINPSSLDAGLQITDEGKKHYIDFLNKEIVSLKDAAAKQSDPEKKAELETLVKSYEKEKSKDDQSMNQSLQSALLEQEIDKAVAPHVAARTTVKVKKDKSIASQWLQVASGAMVDPTLPSGASVQTHEQLMTEDVDALTNTVNAGEAAKTELIKAQNSKDPNVKTSYAIFKGHESEFLGKSPEEINKLVADLYTKYKEKYPNTSLTREQMHSNISTFIDNTKASEKHDEVLSRLKPVNGKNLESVIPTTLNTDVAGVLKGVDKKALIDELNSGFDITKKGGFFPGLASVLGTFVQDKDEVNVGTNLYGSNDMAEKVINNPKQYPNILRAFKNYMPNQPVNKTSVARFLKDVYSKGTEGGKISSGHEQSLWSSAVPSEISNLVKSPNIVNNGGQTLTKEQQSFIANSQSATIVFNPKGAQIAYVSEKDENVVEAYDINPANDEFKISVLKESGSLPKIRAILAGKNVELEDRDVNAINSFYGGGATGPVNSFNSQVMAIKNSKGPKEGKKVTVDINGRKVTLTVKSASNNTLFFDNGESERTISKLITVDIVKSLQGNSSVTNAINHYSKKALEGGLGLNQSSEDNQ